MGAAGRQPALLAHVSTFQSLQTLQIWKVSNTDFVEILPHASPPILGNANAQNGFNPSTTAIDKPMLRGNQVKLIHFIAISYFYYCKSFKTNYPLGLREETRPARRWNLPSSFTAQPTPSRKGIFCFASQSRWVLPACCPRVSLEGA